MINNYAIVTVRSSSSRLPNKSTKIIYDEKTTLEIVIQRAKLTNLPVLIATSTDKSDDIIYDIAIKNNILCFRGSLKNKINRWYNCFKKFNIKNALLVDGDDLLYNYDIAKRAIKRLSSDSSIDMIIYPEDIICGYFTYAVTFNAISKMYAIVPSPEIDTDVITKYIEFAKLNIKQIELNEWERGKSYRLTLDYQEDFDMFKKMIEKIGYKVSGKELTDALNDNLEILEINQFRQSDYLDNQKNFNEKVKNA